MSPDKSQLLTLHAQANTLALQAAAARLHAELPPEAHLSFGVGIHYGDDLLGWIGAEQRPEFSAIGDSINTVRRIQENAGKNQILLSSTYMSA